MAAKNFKIITSEGLVQPEDIVADLIEDGGTSWTKPLTSGPLWP